MLSLSLKIPKWFVSNQDKKKLGENILGKIHHITNFTISFKHILDTQTQVTLQYLGKEKRYII